jgi:hypothetical protein
MKRPTFRKLPPPPDGARVWELEIPIRVAEALAAAGLTTAGKIRHRRLPGAVAGLQGRLTIIPGISPQDELAINEALGLFWSS